MIPFRLALRDWLSEWPTSACLAIGVAAAAIPLLLLLSIRTGIITQLRGELERFPSSRELTTVGQPDVRWPLVARLSRHPDAAFVAPLTRLLSASAVLRTERGDTGSEVDLLPSGPGDPLLPRAWDGGALVLSEATSRELGAGTGDRLRLLLNRTNGAGRGEIVVLTLPVAGVVPTAVSASTRKVALVAPRLLLASEIWREDAAVPDFATALARAERERERRDYAGLRVYARSVDGVERLRQQLLDEGIDTESRIDDIRLVRRLDHGLSIFLVVIGGVTALGLCLSLAAAQWGWVERKRADLSYLRLIGLDGVSVALIPLWQTVLTVAAGVAIATAFAWGAHLIINALFAGQLATVKDVSIFSVAQVGWVSLLAFLAGGLAALLAALNAQRITPITALRGG